MTARKKPSAAKVQRAQQRSLQRALQEERLAIAAIVKVMLIEVPDPRRVLARLDAMTRAAEANPRVPATVRRQLIDATRFVRTAIERETARPQSLLDPHVGHVDPGDVDALVAPTKGPQQLGLVNNGSTLGDVEEAHEQRVRTITAVHSALVALIREKGAASDTGLYNRYLMANTSGALPAQSKKSIVERRKELLAAGRIVSAPRQNGVPAWDVIERDALTSATA
jgi:hypothetical protein